MDTHDYLPTREYGNVRACIDYFLQQDVNTTARILDIGAHRGSFVAQLDKHRYTNVVGIDIHPDIIEYGKQLHPNIADRLQAYDGQNIPFASESFDVVTMFDVIEHISDPPAFLKQVYQRLRPGGKFIFQTPNKFTNIPWEIARTRSFTIWRKYHLSLQTLLSLRNLLASVGFQDIHIDRYNIKTPYNIQKTKRVLGKPGIFLLHMASRMPLMLYPNFWGSCYKAPARK